MKIIRVFGIVVGIHLFALMLIFANPGCSSSSKPTPAPSDTVAKADTPPPPTVGADSYAVTGNTLLDTSLIPLSVSANDGPGTITLETAPTHGTLNLNTSTGHFTYLPTVGYLGADSFVYRVTNAGGGTGMAVLAWSPLAQGRLGDSKAGGERADAVRAALDAIASEKGVSRTDIAYAWIMAHPARPIPIIGSQQPARIQEAVRSLEVSLSRPEWYSILTAARGVPLP